MREVTPKWGQAWLPAWGDEDAWGNGTTEPQHRAPCSPHCKQRQAERRWAHGKERAESRRKGGGQEAERREGDSLKIPRSWRVSKYQQLFPEHKINTLETHALCRAALPAPRAALFPRQPRHLALLDGSSRGVPALLTARQHPASQTQHRRPLLQ